MKLLRHYIPTLALAFASAFASSAQAFCGFYAGKADAQLFNEASQVVMARDGKRTVISMQNDYKGPLSDFALVVPTPVTLKEGQVRVADKLTFSRLDAYSSPRLAEYHDDNPCQLESGWGLMRPMQERAMTMAGAAPMAQARSTQDIARDKALGVTVDVQYTLEEYDIISLSATQSDGLETWLAENGYKLPKGASAALRPYINQGMKFFVAKVNLKEQLKTGYSTLRPLQFAFESEKFMLPMRLGMLNAAPDKAQDLIIYLLTKQGRVESSNYRTVKLPSNVNLPPMVKPRFQDFYKALFDHQAARENLRVVFTEYFWDMGWCDPCADQPLSPQELKNAGVFWDASEGLPVLTRLHVRYNANSFPEDLLFTQTRDRQNWQTRYVLQTPYESSVAACSAQAGQIDCATQCRPRVAQMSGRPQSWGAANPTDTNLQSDCERACTAAKQAGVAAASHYYLTELPQRLVQEKRTLAQLTGWKLSDIDTLLGTVTPVPAATPSATPTTPKPWWELLFGSSKAAS